MSLTVIMPLRLNLSSTIRTFSRRCLCSSSRTSFLSAPSRTVTRRSLGVITSRTLASRRVSKRTSREVTIPTRSPFSSTGTPEMLFRRVRSNRSRTVASASMVIGSLTTPASNFLTLRTSAACCSMVMFLWMMPMPPSCAMAMARRDSVTVSIAAETSGMFSSIPRVRRVLRETSFGRTSE
ncbi:hypothetical protein D3C75_839130 [compost metagenome]